MLFPNHDEETLVLDEIDELLDDVANGSVLIVHNDDHNTFDWVIECLISICKHTKEQAEQCALFIHFKGKYGVKHASKKVLKPMKDALVDRGLSVTIEDC
ncbi:MAG: ATP-dependent Clp protease adaptor ClpS [Bacteroidetes bacterium]|jgi:ATP-dependent Clp protease adaptor protein ClpS|nr:ATP-dependent Clp protease adaptor ClpS [Bacteroidota bacterium]MBK8671639.1 ATP-dependent Clp protease adaptor ClpS [Bacteroidota bacterium]MBK9353231.1 ATP-dependent Clp protease adaptor ClpS [Bacteroidota bacterium]MBK9632934.1 ATP-dependent Clp protease adaptor ClpS [Bacteroidota bacterium]MBL0079753.1 ATP-dependent Clp protease adaptor ClpS [Bacteroidota bacterium]